LWGGNRSVMVITVAVLFFQVIIIIYFYVFNLFERLFVRRILPYIKRRD